MKKMRAVDIIAKVVKNMRGKKPSRKKMIEDLCVMRIKIKSQSGDMSILGPLQTSFLESVWTIGKIEEVIRCHIDDLEACEQVKLMELLGDLGVGMQEKSPLDISASFSSDLTQSQDPTFEVYRMGDDQEKLIVN